MNSRLFKFKRLFSFAGISTLSILIALPTLAQTNTRPTIFNEPPYNQSGEVPAAPDPGVSQEPAPAPMEMEAPTGAEIPQESTEAAEAGTIVDVAASNGSFETLVAALTATELDQLLQGEGPFTVFAPTDEAFAALPEGTLDELLLPENRDLLIQILSYHVIPGAFASSELTSGEVQTAANELVSIEVNETGVTVNEATVVQPDITASNGVIHVVDQVLLPPSL